MIEEWDDLKFWQTGEWQVIQERLDDLKKAKKVICPKRESMFLALDKTPFKECTVAILGQDPYPDPKFATGLAFSIPEQFQKKDFPITLKEIYSELSNDLRLDDMKSLYHISTGCLDRWAEQGVLLWNVIPTCTATKSKSHDWPEYKLLTQEIIEELSRKPVVFAFLGGMAREFVKYVDQDESFVIEASHPSPRGSRFSDTPFKGCRLFSKINDRLAALGLGKIDWRL
jgi:uracil-DNA glycosylase